MANVDNQVLAADPTYTTVLAAYLNAAMANSQSAQAAYARIYGTSWASLGNGVAINDGESTSAQTVA